MRRANLKETAQYLGQSDSTTWRWAWDGYLPCIKLGRDTGKERRRYTYVFDLDEVDAWLEGQKRPGRTDRVPEIAS